MKLRSPLRRWWPALVALVVIVAAALTLAVVTSESDDALVVYNGRSHYGGEEAFAAFTRETGIKVKLFGGEAQTLHDRLVSEGDSTKADLLVTVDGANLARAKDQGLLAEVSSSVIDDAIPEELRDPDGTWTAVSTRVRTIVRSTERVAADAVDSYTDLADPRWKGRVCLRSSNSIYNQSLVADFLAKRGASETEALLRSWMANDPQIFGNDVLILNAIKSGECDLGLVNHYYLVRQLLKDADFPATPAWPDQGANGAHANLSGAGVVKGTDRFDDAVKLLEFLTQREAQDAIAANGEFPANPTVEPIDIVAPWRDIKLDPIDSAGAAEHAKDAVALMQRVGWE
jgi:iron(III) transport system substrate-binding protein